MVFEWFISLIFLCDSIVKFPLWQWYFMWQSSKKLFEQHREQMFLYDSKKPFAISFKFQTNTFLLSIPSWLLWVSIISLKHMAKNEVSLGNTIYNFILCYWRKKIFWISNKNHLFSLRGKCFTLMKWD